MKPKKWWAKVVRGIHAAYGVFLYSIALLMLYTHWALALLILTLIVNVVLYTKYDGCILTILANWIEKEGT